MKHAVAFVPNKIQIVDVLLIGIIKSNLPLDSIVLELPIGRGCNHKVNGLICNEVH
jgi:hypothetical protein